jgi:hypothetical protein
MSVMALPHKRRGALSTAPLHRCREDWVMNNDKKKIFAFKLAEKKEQGKTPAAKWKARDGVSVAGCTDAIGDGSYREAIDIWGNYRGIDKGYWC